MEKKVQQLVEQLPSLEEELGRPDVFQDKENYKKLTQRHSYLSELTVSWNEYNECKESLIENRKQLESETDEEFLEVLKEDILFLEKRVKELEKKLNTLLVPPDPNDHRPTILELRAGTGGDEAALFVGDCVRMYTLFADLMGWSCEPMSFTSSEAGGYKEYIMTISGTNVHRFMQYEAGTHRVQRVPETEAQGRVHTSAITVAAMLEPDEEEDIDLDEKELRIETYRASGAGGQHVNTTDSAVRITHLPTGMVSYCMQERSQHKNKDKAMRLLKAKIVEEERRKKDAERASTRQAMVGSGDRSERIRTYNFPQNRLTDHRINLTLYSLDHVMDGELSEVVEALVAHFYAEQLNEAGDQ
jgi:peptide chain release factor 1